MKSYLTTLIHTKGQSSPFVPDIAQKLILLSLFLLTTSLFAQPVITFSTSPYLELDSNMPGVEGPSAAYIGFEIDNTTASLYTDLKATLTLTGAGFALAGGQVATQEVGVSGMFAPGQKEALYWFISYPNTFNTPVTATITLTGSGGPLGAPVSAVIETRSTISANAGGLLQSVMIGPGTYVGQILYYDVRYTFGNIKKDDYVNMQPAGSPLFNAGCFQLIDAEIMPSLDLSTGLPIPGIPGINVGDRDRLYYQATANNTGSGIPVTVRYYFYVKCVNIGATNALPYAATRSGNQFKYSGNYGLSVMIPDPLPSIAIAKSVTPSKIPDPATTLPDEVVYTVTVTNVATVPVSIQKITDMLPSPPNIEYVGIEAGSDVTASNSASLPAAGATGTLMFVSDDIPADANSQANYYIPVGGSIDLIYRVNIKTTIPYPASYVNIATATTGNYTTPPANSVVTLGLLEVADLELTKAVSYTHPNYGETITYTLTLTNTGSDPATNVQLCDLVPDGIMFIAASVAPTTTMPSGTATNYCWNIASIPVNGSATITYTAKAVQGAGLTYKNYAQVTGADQVDPDNDHSVGFGVDDLGDGIADDDEACVEIFPCEPITFTGNQIQVLDACPNNPATAQVSGIPFTGTAVISYEIIPVAGPNITGTSGLVSIVNSVATFFIPGLPIGTYQLSTITVADGNGCRNTVSGLNIVFNVQDVTPPTIVCPADITVKCAGDVPVVDLGEIVVNDDCGPITPSLDAETVSNQECVNRYTLTRVYKATDGVNLMATCSQTIRVDFPLAPVITANACATTLTLPTVPPIAGFTVEYSINGSAFVPNPTLPTAQGSYTFKARYVLSAACGSTPAGTADTDPDCSMSNEVTTSIPAVPTVTPLAEICSGGSIDLSTLILSNTTGSTVTYHSTAADAVAGTPAIGSVVAPASAANYFIRVAASATCFAVKEVTVTIKPQSCGTITVTGPN